MEKAGKEVTTQTKKVLDELHDYLLNAEIHRRDESGACRIDCNDVFATLEQFTNIVLSRERKEGEKAGEEVTTFRDTDFPDMATHCEQSECGFSLVLGVLVQWDEDHDLRVIDVLNKMPTDLIKRLLIVQEHEGCIAFVWKGKVPVGYNVGGEEIDVPDGDVWPIASSIATPNVD